MKKSKITKSPREIVETADRLHLYERKLQLGLPASVIIKRLSEMGFPGVTRGTLSSIILGKYIYGDVVEKMEALDKIFTEYEKERDKMRKENKNECK